MSGSGAGAPEASKYTRWPSHSPLAAAANAASTRANEDDADADADARAGVRGPRARERRGRSDAPPIEARREDVDDIARTRQRPRGGREGGLRTREAIARDRTTGGGEEATISVIRRRRDGRRRLN